MAGVNVGQNLTAEMPSMASATTTASIRPGISWHTTLEAGWQESRTRNLPMVIFITSERCHGCDLMKRDTWWEESVRSRMRNGFVAISLSPSRNSRTLNRTDNLPNHAPRRASGQDHWSTIGLSAACGVARIPQRDTSPPASVIGRRAAGRLLNRPWRRSLFSLRAFRNRSRFPVHHCCRVERNEW